MEWNLPHFIHFDLPKISTIYLCILWAGMKVQPLYFYCHEHFHTHQDLQKKTVLLRKTRQPGKIEVF
jgi:hypothetical protein